MTYHADLNGLVRFAERRNLFSARVPSYFKRSLTQVNYYRSVGVELEGVGSVLDVRLPVIVLSQQ